MREMLLTTLNAIACLEHRLEEYAAAEKHFRELLQLDEPLSKGETVKRLRRRVDAYFLLGLGLNLRERNPEALEALVAASRVGEQLSRLEGSNAQDSDTLASTLESIAELGKPEDARGAYARAVEVRKKLSEQSPSDLAAKEALAATYYSLASLDHEAKRYADALLSFGQSVEIRRLLVVAEPASVERRDVLAATLDSRADAWMGDGKYEPALADLKESLSLRAKLQEEQPEDAGRLRALSVSFNKLGLLTKAAGDYASALKLFGADLALSSQLASAQPGNAGFQRDVIISLEALAETLELAGNSAAATPLCSQLQHALAQLEASATEPAPLALPALQRACSQRRGTMQLVASAAPKPLRPHIDEATLGQ